MSEKPKSERRRREYSVERDRNALPFLWTFGIGGLVVGLCMVGSGFILNLPEFYSSGLLILVVGGIILRIAFKGREQIKEIDAQKSFEPPVE